MAKPPSPFISLKEAVDEVRVGFRDVSHVEAQEWIKTGWREGWINLYDAVGEPVTPDVERELQLDFEKSESVREGSVLVIEIPASEDKAPTRLELSSAGRQVRINLSQLSGRIQGLNSSAAARESGSRRTGTSTPGDQMKQAFCQMRDAGKLKKSMLMKEIHNEVMIYMFGDAEKRKGYSYDTFRAHVGPDVKAWQSS